MSLFYSLNIHSNFPSEPPSTHASETEEQRAKRIKLKELRYFVRGKVTDIVIGKTLAKVFFMIALGGLATVFLSMYVSKSRNFVENSRILAQAVNLENEWDQAVNFPLISGVTVSLVSGFLVQFFMLNVHRARKLKKNVQGVDGKKPEIGPKFGGPVKILNVIAQVIVLLLLVGQLAIALTGRSILIAIEDSLDQVGAVSDDLKPGSFQSKVYLFQFAAFNRCCFDSGFARQDKVNKCPKPPACGLEPEYALFADTLCRCYIETDERYTSMENLIDETDSCSKLSQVSVTFSRKDIIPGTSVHVSTVFQETQVPLVGDPEFDGCGDGLALGFQFVYFSYFQNALLRMLNTLIGITCVQLLAFLYGFIITRLGVDREIVDEKVREEYLEGKKKSPSSFLASKLSFLSKNAAEKKRSLGGLFSKNSMFSSHVQSIEL